MLLRADDNTSGSSAALTAKVQSGSKHTVSERVGGLSLPYSRFVHLDCLKELDRRRDYRRMPGWMPSVGQRRELPACQEDSTLLEVRVAMTQQDPKSVRPF